MDKPWKVIAAFIGVFVAGAVFGGFFSVGVGARWLAKETPTTTVQPVTAPTPNVPANAEPKNGRPGPAAATAAALAARQSLLQIPQSWQAPQLLRRYAERLELTPEQKQKIHPLIQRASEDYNRLRQNTWRETAIILQRLQQDISEVLTPEQRDKLRQIEQRQHELIEAEQKAREQREQQKKAGAPQRPGQNRPPGANGEKPAAPPAPKPAVAPVSASPTPSGAPTAAASTGASSGTATSTASASTEKQE